MTYCVRKFLKVQLQNYEKKILQMFSIEKIGEKDLVVAIQLSLEPSIIKSSML